MHKVLLVDDDESILDYLANLLKGSYEVSTAKGPIEGFARYVDLRHDLVIVDLIMPFLDGYGLIDKIEAAGHNPKFIILTGAPENIQKSEAYSDIIVVLKPFSDKAFVEAIARVLDK